MELQEMVDVVADKYNAEVYMYFGTISRYRVRRMTSSNFVGELHPNALLILETRGGDSHAAFQMVRFLRKRHPKGKVILFADGLCKSAGTLIAIGSNEVIISDYGELGPLDIQVEKPEDIGGYYSGLVAIKALGVLHEQSYQLFEEHLDSMIRKSGLQFSAKTAELASKLTIGLFEPIYAQIDPIWLGENQRAIEISRKYGEQLKTENVKSEALETLISTYPSHGFVIDREAASELFENVREPDSSLIRLVGEIRPLINKALEENQTIAVHFNRSKKDTEEQDGNEEKPDSSEPQRATSTETSEDSGDGRDPDIPEASETSGNTSEAS